jgi:hypothetical protein
MRFLLLAMMMAVCGCSPSAKEDYVPLAVGDEWTMGATVVSATGHALECIARRQIEGAVERDGKIYFRSRSTMEGMPTKVEITKLVRKDEKGFFSIEEAKKGAVEQTEIVLPLKVGNTWKRTMGSTSVTDTVIGVESVSISGKTYDKCYRIRSVTADNSLTEDFWQAPHVGDVKSVITYGSGAKITLTLKEFKPGK